MFAQCPTCHTLYQVGAADLNVTRGRLHCDFCDTTFDALGSLTDHPLAQGNESPQASISAADELEERELDDAVATGAEPSPSAVESSASPEASEHAEGFAVEEIAVEETTASEFTTEQIAAAAIGTDEMPASAASPDAAPHASEASDELHETDAEAPPREIDAPAAPPEAEAHAAPAPPVPVDAQATVAPQAQPDAEPEDPGALDLDTLLGIRRSPWTRAWWSALAVLMLLLLGVQLVHRSRSELIMHPSIAPWMYRIYGALGLRLDPKWEVERYRIVRRPEMSAVVSADGATRLRFVATLTNDAARPQPYPLVRLTLEDRWGSAVGERDFAPGEYLHDDARAASLLAPGELAQVELLVVDPGADTVGFHVDMCLADGDEVIRCANDDS